MKSKLCLPQKKHARTKGYYPENKEVTEGAGNKDQGARSKQRLQLHWAAKAGSRSEHTEAELRISLPRARRSKPV